MSSIKPQSFAKPQLVRAIALAGRMVFPCCCAIFLLAQHTDSKAASQCVSSMTPADAYRNAAAVFMGEAIEVKKQAVHTRAGSTFLYQETTLRVIKSWKLIDRQEVTVTTAPAHAEKSCFTFTPGKTYVVYAVWMNDTLYASLRTGEVDNAEADLEMLGNGRLALKPGTFSSDAVFIYGIITLAVGVLLLSCSIYRLAKKPLRTN